MKYDHKKIDKKWQQFWDTHKIFTTPDSVPGKDNFYLLVEFPYPSGNLHAGHWYAFAVPDILARYQRMCGKNVLYPIGFDAFGLPAENAAIKNGVNPADWTESNIAFMKKQIRSMGASFDWSREVATCRPDYYKWTQWLFLQLHKKGLVYRKETAVNWCPKDKTVLANEQVVDGTCERCGCEVEQRQMLQWNIKITEYADRLIDDLEKLDWPEQIKEAQRNWIGRSEGAELDFRVAGSNDVITVFTTRADTIFGATFLALAPEHPYVGELLKQESVLQNGDEVKAYIARTNKLSDMDRQTSKEKSGARLMGVMAVNPASGEQIPVYITDYVLPQYGTGAIMAVPAHDERDFAFAKKFDLPIRRVVEPLAVGTVGDGAVQPDLPFVKRDAVCVFVRNPKDDTYLCISWKGMHMHGLVTGGIDDGEDPVVAAMREVREETGYKNLRLVSNPGICNHTQFFHRVKKVNRWARFTNIFLELENEERDVVDEAEEALHDVVWKKKEELESFFSVFEGKFILSILNNPDYIHTGEGVLAHSGDFDWMTSGEARIALTEKFGRKKTTYRLRDWIVSRQRYWGVPIPMIHCATCGQIPVPDTQLPVLLPEVKDYLPDGGGKSPLAKVSSFVNIECPSCGGAAERETDTLDTFVDSSWYFLRYTDPLNTESFADREKQDAWMPVDMYSGGAEHTTMHLLYSRFWHKALFDMGLTRDSEPYTRRTNHGMVLGPDGQKMSKSKGNVLDPDELVDRLGADTVRMYLAFMGPYTGGASYPWNPDGVVGIRRFLERLAKAREYVQEDEVGSLNNVLHKSIKKVGEDVAVFKFNTAISQLMILLNAVEKEKVIGRNQFELLALLIAPFAPHLAEELWSSLGHDSSISAEHWPVYDDKLLVDDMVTYAIQVNGKTRGDVAVPHDADKSAVETAARAVVENRFEGAEVSRVIVVPGRLVNFVLKN